MRKRFVIAIVILVSLLLVFSATSMAQGGGQRGAGGGQRGGRGQAPEAPPNPNFDPHDFSGYWLKNTVRPKDSPPLTPAGIKAMEGRLKGQAELMGRYGR